MAVHEEFVAAARNVVHPLRVPHADVVPEHTNLALSNSGGSRVIDVADEESFDALAEPIDCQVS